MHFFLNHPYPLPDLDTATEPTITKSIFTLSSRLIGLLYSRTPWYVNKSVISEYSKSSKIQTRVVRNTPYFGQSGFIE